MSHLTNAETAEKTNESPQNAWKIAARCGIQVVLVALVVVLFIYAVPWIEMTGKKFFSTDFGVQTWVQELADRIAHAVFLCLTLGGKSIMFPLFGCIGCIAAFGWMICVYSKLENGLPHVVIIPAALILAISWLCFYISAQSMFVDLKDLASMEMFALFVASIPLAILFILMFCFMILVIG